jgi:protein ImuB
MVRRRWRPEAGPPVVLTTLDHQREIVAECCAVAARHGVHVGMTVAHARALIPGGRVHVEAFSAERNARWLARLAVWMLRFAPRVGLDSPNGLWLDATGCGRLHRSPGRLAARIIGGLQGAGIGARVAVAPTWGAAWGFARFGDRRITVVREKELAACVSALPTAALRLDPQTIDALSRVGIKRAADLLCLPRTSLADRYGETLLLRLDQAMGQALETIETIRPREPVLIERVFDGPTTRSEDIGLAVWGLVDEAAARLLAVESGCRRFTVVLERSDLDPLVLEVSTSRPTRDAAHLWSLVKHRLEAAHLGFGVEGVAVRAGQVVRLAHEQSVAWGNEVRITNRPGGPSSAEVGRLVDTLSARMGPGRVLRVLAAESHLPERAFVHEAVTRLDRPRRPGAAAVDADRPSLLLASPVPADVVLLVPDGPIASVCARGRGASVRVVTCIGPERIEGRWWRGGTGRRWENGARDYFQVQTDHGEWLWLFRCGSDRSWFVHGEWA